MKKFGKFLALTLALVLVVSAFAGCTPAPASSAPPADAPATDTPAEPKDAAGVKIGLIAETFGTQSFNDDVLAGLNLAQEKLGVTAMPLEVAEVADVANSLRTLIGQGCEMLIVPSASFRDGMEEVAAEYTDLKFLYLAEVIDGGANIMSIEYKENQASFLAGALAGLMTKSNKIGAVIATAEPLQLRYQYGFQAGAKAVNPECEVQVATTNSYQDVGKGKEVANVMYSKGADFVGTFSGACNLGVFEAAKEAGEGKYAFGAANGQFDKMPDKIMASVIKPVDKAVFSIIEDFLAGSFDTNEPKSLGLKEGGVDLLFTNNEELLKIIPADVKAAVDDLKAKIISGEIVVPAVEEEFNSFTYSHK